jgi:hypothetical protein
LSETFSELWRIRAGVPFNAISTDTGTFYLGDSRNTIFAIVQHPADRRSKNEYFHQVGFAVATRLEHVQGRKGGLMAERVFGEIPGYPEGTYFESRVELSRAGVHRPLQAGISGSAYEGADSIVVSGGYEDDRDNGFEIIYTGHGGRDPETGEQVADQELTRGNMALVYSMKNMLPVRVVRGATPTPPFSPKAGYRYDGLYLVEEYCQEKGKSGYIVWRYKLVKEDTTTAPWLSGAHVQAKGSVGDKARAAPNPIPKPTSPRSSTNLPKRPRLPQAEEPAPPQFKVGEYVRHPIFGNGQVLDVSPSGEDQILTVQFSALGKKRLMAKAAKLEPLPRNSES